MLGDKLLRVSLRPLARPCTRTIEPLFSGSGEDGSEDQAPRKMPRSNQKGRGVKEEALRLPHY